MLATVICDIAKHRYQSFFFEEIVKLHSNMIETCRDCKSESNQVLLSQKRETPHLKAITVTHISVSEQNCC